ELATSTMEKRPVLVIILNNYFLGMVRQWQELFYKERFSSSSLASEGGSASKDTQPDPAKDPYIPDFVKLAEAHGGVGI
ncbi:thiamine pyrophosphate-dependent enzyme, partial [Klebsiella pneumoniae]|uniref:thiamine pyrophosphate-dependent enzyme n=1 Tax=Klebsiella pneumoniae TaxID=573 RepID=UPI003013E44B